MRSVLYLLILMLPWLISCGENPGVKSKKEPEAKKKPATVENPIQKQVPKDPLINNKNVREKLLAYGKDNPECHVVFHTDKGIIKATLFKDTPLHRANFIMMAKSGCFDNTVFTRVHIDFMAQAGGTYDEKNVKTRKEIGKFTIPHEILPHHYHRQGALAAARRYNGNPQKRSDPYAFYFVEGTTYNKPTLDKYEVDNQYTYSAEQRQYYRINRGAAHIDGQHTVFGQVTQGLDVISAITHVKTDGRDWPITDIYVKRVEVLP